MTRNGQLTITNDRTIAAGGLLDGTGTISGDFRLLNQALSSAGGTGTLARPTVKVATAGAPCYAAGTRIRSRDGEVPVERLAVGDIVLAHFAGATPVLWIGHRHIDCRRHPSPTSVWPVRVSAHAFEPRMPQRDLLLSPDHAVFVDDVLVPIKHLINDETIRQEKVTTIIYYHIELGEHDVLLANGMPAESYLENGDRCEFDNGGDRIRLHPVFGADRREAFGCAPLVMAGEKLTAVVTRLRARIPRKAASKRLSFRSDPG